MRGRLVLFALLLAALAAPADAQDRVLMQGFYWDAQPGGVWYDSLTTQAARLGWAGFDAIWLPPPTKGAASGSDVGYTPYDYYDLGGYDSCGGDYTEGTGSCLPTRYGTEAGLREAITTLQGHGLEVYADVVLNHRSGGTLEDNVYGDYYTGGGSLYSEDGRTYTAFPLTNGSGRVAWTDGDEFFFPNGANNPDNTFDFYSDSQLAGFHQLYVNSFAYDNALHDGSGANLALGDSLIAWGEWLTTELGLDGYRFDFVKGLHPDYLRRFVDAPAMQGKFHVHELYDGDLGRLQTYLGQLAGSVRAPAVFDFNQRFAYRDVLDNGAPIFTWHDTGLHNQFGVPFDQIVTFVDNHDFDRTNYEGQVTIDGHAPVVNNKMLAYAHMLTHPGMASVWWRDYYHYNLAGPIDELVAIRKAFASGDYFALTRGTTGGPFWPAANPPNPWESLYVGQRNGDGPGRGLIVAINKHPDQWAEVFVTQQNGAWTGQVLKDLTGNAGGGTTEVFGDNRVRLWAPPQSYTVWVPTSYTLPDAGPVPASDAPSYFGIDASSLDAPAASVVTVGTPISVGVTAYVHGKTNAVGAAPGVVAEIGWGTPGTDPATWTDWQAASYTGEAGPSDRFEASLTLPVGVVDLAARVSYDGQPARTVGLGGFWDDARNPSAEAVVFDPGAGSFDGGGRVESPPGSYPEAPARPSRSRVALDLRYEAGQATGEVTLRTRGAPYSFTSTALDWIVIDGRDASVRGTATTIGADPVTFLITARDGETVGNEGDRLRIQVWHADGSVLYDNLPSASYGEMSALAGGNLTARPPAPAERAGGPATRLSTAATALPEALTLAAPFPNPSRSSATLRFGVPADGPVEVVVVSVLGQEVARLADGAYPAGWHTATVDTDDLAPGAYLVVIRAGAVRQTQRLVVVR